MQSISMACHGTACDHGNFILMPQFFGGMYFLNHVMFLLQT